MVHMRSSPSIRNCGCSELRLIPKTWSCSLQIATTEVTEMGRSSTGSGPPTSRRKAFELTKINHPCTVVKFGSLRSRDRRLLVCGSLLHDPFRQIMRRRASYARRWSRFMITNNVLPFEMNRLQTYQNKVFNGTLKLEEDKVLSATALLPSSGLLRFSEG